MTADPNVIPEIDLDLDSLDRPEREHIKPFRVNIGGKPITFSDPSELDWQTLLEIEEPTGLIRYTVSEEDREHIAKQKIPGWKLGKLMEAFMKHYNLEGQLAEAKRKAALGI